jgi:hypothetical protein
LKAALPSLEEGPADECIDNHTSMKISIVPTKLKDEYPNDESRLTSKVGTSKERTTGEEGEKKKFLSSSFTNSPSKPFDEVVKNTQKVESVGGFESAPDDEKQSRRQLTKRRWKSTTVIAKNSNRSRLW